MDPDRKIRTERFRLSSCEGKVAFKSAAVAKRAASRRGGRMIYKCRFCRYFHTGTPSPVVKTVKKRVKRVVLFETTEWIE